MLGRWFRRHLERGRSPEAALTVAKARLALEVAIPGRAKGALDAMGFRIWRNA